MDLECQGRNFPVLYQPRTAWELWDQEVGCHRGKLVEDLKVEQRRKLKSFSKLLIKATGSGIKMTRI